MSKTFTIILRQLVVPHGESEAKLAARAAARLECAPEDIVAIQPVRRSIDARKRRGKAVDVYHVRVELPNRLRRQVRKATHLDVVFESGGPNLSLSLTDPAPMPGVRPVVVGAGPAGLFAALRLARAGWKPLLLERSDCIDDRRGVAAAFWRNGTLDPESNVLFGEGGAGLFSDGKLNTRHKDREGMAAILAAMVTAGAPEDIRLQAAPPRRQRSPRDGCRQHQQGNPRLGRRNPLPDGGDGHPCRRRPPARADAAVRRHGRIP